MPGEAASDRSCSSSCGDTEPVAPRPGAGREGDKNKIRPDCRGNPKKKKKRWHVCRKSSKAFQPFCKLEGAPILIVINADFFFFPNVAKLAIVRGMGVEGGEPC